MKVGDIEMDSRTGISFGDASVPAAPNDARRKDSSESAGSIVRRLPRWSPLTYVALAALGLAASVGTGVAAIFLAGEGSTFWLLPAIPAPGLLLASGLFAWRAMGGNEHAAELDEVDQLAAQRCDRIAAHLSDRTSPASIEELMTELGWSEEAVVDGLDAGVRQQRIDEDLDLQTGHWHYAAPSHDAADADARTRKALPVDERAAQLEDKRSQ